MTTVKLATLSDIRNWSGDIESLLSRVRAMSHDEIDALAGQSRVSNTLHSYLYLEGSTVPTHTTIGGLPRELATELRDIFKPLRTAKNHRQLRECYQQLLALYDRVPDTATGRVNYIPLVRNRVTLVRMIDFAVAIHRAISRHVQTHGHPTYTQDEVATLGRGMLLGTRTIPLLSTAEQHHCAILKTLDVLYPSKSV